MAEKTLQTTNLSNGDTITALTMLLYIQANEGKGTCFCFKAEQYE